MMKTLILTNCLRSGMDERDGGEELDNKREVQLQTKFWCKLAQRREAGQFSKHL